MYFNYYYFMFMLPGLIIGLIAQLMVKSTFSKYNRVNAQSGLTGAQAARQILDLNNLQAVAIKPIGGQLSDNFDPRSSVINLSQSTYGNSSIGAIGVAAHECGHAVQHGTGYLPIKLRSALVPVTSFGSSLAIPLILIGLLFNAFGLAYLGIFLFSFAVLFQLVTLPVEFNASRRAIKTLGETGMLTQEELSGAKKVLTAAALTYVAALLTSMLQLLYYVSIVGGRSNRRR